MSTLDNAVANGQVISYRVRNTRVEIDPPRRVDVEAAREQILALVRDGYLVRESLVSGSLLAELRRASDEIEASALARSG